MKLKTTELLHTIDETLHDVFDAQIKHNENNLREEINQEVRLEYNRGQIKIKYLKTISAKAVSYKECGILTSGCSGSFSEEIQGSCWV